MKTNLLIQKKKEFTEKMLLNHKIKIVIRAKQILLKLIKLNLFSFSFLAIQIAISITPNNNAKQHITKAGKRTI